ncbi:MAG: NUDIX domain-containing protein [Patescibacteria group bacterium]
MAVSPRELHRVVPTVLIYNEEGKFLLIKRSPDLKIFPGKWHSTGGGVSMDDYEHLPSATTNHKQWYGVVEHALRRETREEAGIEIGKPEYLLDVVFIRPDGIPVIVLSYFAPYASGEVIKTDEAVEHAWVTFEEAKKYDLIDGILGEIEMVDKILKERKNEKV